MKVSGMLVILDVIIWCWLFLVAGLRFEKATESVYELKRRKTQGDSQAAQILAYEALIPRLETLRQLKLFTLLVVGSALSVATYGWIVGGAVAIVLVWLLGTITRANVVAHVSKWLFGHIEPWIMTRITHWKWLDSFASYAQPVGEYRVTSKDELRELVTRSQGVLSRDELLRFQANLSLDERTVHDAMTPVLVVDTADVSDSLGPLVLDSLHKTGHSRFPVIDGDVHHIVGVLYLHNLVDLRNTKKTVKEAMDKEVYYIHENQSLEHALHGFLSSHRHLFVVVNDYRETVGVITLEDVVEEVLGKKIVDEFDTFDDLIAVAANNPHGNNQPKDRTDRIYKHTNQEN